MTTTAVTFDDHGGFRATARQPVDDAGFGVVGEAAEGDFGDRPKASTARRFVRRAELAGMAPIGTAARTA